MPALLLAATSGLPDWLIDTLGPILAGQAIVGVVGLIGLSVLFRRFVGTEFPAFVADVRGDLREIDQDLRGLRSDFNAARLEVENLKERVRSLERRTDNLDDTASRRRRPPA